MNDAAVAADRLTIIVGDDALALSVAAEMRRLHPHRVVVIGSSDPEFAATVAAVGATHIAGSPDRGDTLERADVGIAQTIIAVSRDDQLNLHVVLLARDANPHIRIVLRQFNRTLAYKIEQNLPDCSVLSLAWHSAASYAATALDPTCIHGLQFPEPEGPLTGFALRRAPPDMRGAIADLEAMLGARVVAVDGNIEVERAAPVPSGAQLCLFGRIADLMRSTPPTGAGEAAGVAAAPSVHRSLARFVRANPYLAGFAALGLAIFVMGAVYFRISFGVDWLTATYFVLSTMTTTGYGDVTPDKRHVFDVMMAMILMLSGVTLTGIFIAASASLLTRAQWVRVQGLRHVHRSGHIIVCGAGSIGSGVIDLLRHFDKPLVVVEASPDSTMVERARDQGFDLLTGDASRDETLDLCNIQAAYSLISLTNIDTLNLEIALGARARNPHMPIVLRIADASFAASIARHFGISTTYSAAALAAPAFAGLARLPGARGRIAFDGREFGIVEITAGTPRPIPQSGEVVPIAVARRDDINLIHDFAEVQADDRVLALVPLARVERQCHQAGATSGMH